MTREEIRIDVTADDEASRVLADVAAQADRLEADPVKLDVDTTGVRRLGDEADQSRSVLANMAGNASQDLGELGGVAGTAGVAIGQLAEYATEGNISLRKLANVAGPMLALGVATKVVSDHMAKVKAADAFSVKQVEGWVDAMREGASLSEAIVDSWRDAGKVELEVGNDVVNLTGALAELNLSVTDYERLTRMSTEQAEEWAAAQRAAGADATAVGLALAGAVAAHDDLAAAEASAAVNAEVFGTAAADTADEVADLTREYDVLQGRLSDRSAYLDVQDAFASVEQAAVDAWTAETEKTGDAEQAARDHERSVIALKEEVMRYAGEVLGLPPEQVTDVLADIDEGSVTSAEMALDRLEQTRTARVNLEVIYGRNRPLGYPAGAPWPPTGGTVAATNVTVNLPRGSRPADVIRTMENYARRNGGRVVLR